MPTLATSPRIVRHAIGRFEDEVRRSADLASRLGYARAWYAIGSEDGRWRFGPSKFVGYDGLTAEQYVEFSRRGLDGRKTEAQLKEWFEELDPSTELHERLSEQLSAFLAEYGKAPSRKTRISIPREDHNELLGIGQIGGNAPVLELIVAVAETLPRREFVLLRERLAAIGR